MNPVLPIFASAAIILTGCASTNPPAFTAAECKEHEPTKEEIDTAVKTYIDTTNWKEPESVRWRNTKLVCRARWTGVGIFAHGRTAAWEIDLEVNGRNSYGGYTGFLPKSINLAGEERDRE